mmetsp:Transcript_29083/g.47567  ORF Transcript_29083/g.47567 Transcript_29083/m.47567 type:complete len:200 (+) Transcript_29083:254-853(+)
MARSPPHPSSLPNAHFPHFYACPICWCFFGEVVSLDQRRFPHPHRILRNSALNLNDQSLNSVSAGISVAHFHVHPSLDIFLPPRRYYRHKPLRYPPLLRRHYYLFCGTNLSAMVLRHHRRLRTAVSASHWHWMLLWLDQHHWGQHRRRHRRGQRYRYRNDTLAVHDTTIVAVNHSYACAFFLHHHWYHRRLAGVLDHHY